MITGEAVAGRGAEAEVIVIMTTGEAETDVGATINVGTTNAGQTNASIHHSSGCSPGHSGCTSSGHSGSCGPVIASTGNLLCLMGLPPCLPRFKG